MARERKALAIPQRQPGAIVVVGSDDRGSIIIPTAKGAPVTFSATCNRALAADLDRVALTQNTTRAKLIETAVGLLLHQDAFDHQGLTRTLWLFEAEALPGPRGSLTVRIGSDHNAALDAMAERSAMTKSELVEAALRLLRDFAEAVLAPADPDHGTGKISKQIQSLADPHPALLPPLKDVGQD